MFNFEYYNPVKTIFGAGAFALTGKKAAAIGRKAMLVNYLNPSSLLPLLDRLKIMLTQEGVQVVDFFAFEENPSIDTVAEGVALAKSQACDMVISLGGGSVMDGGKAIAAGFYYSGELWEMVNHRHDGSGKTIAPPQKALPILCIPTLPATGSEMNMCAVVSNPKLREKSYIWAECLFPTLSILDPELTFSLPPFRTACAAADAISHVLEIYINSRSDTPLQHAFQEGCMRVTMANVRAALANPHNVEARGNLMWAATCAINGWAYPGDGWTPMHQVGHVLTSRYKINHGSSLTVIMPHWMRYCQSRRPEVYKNFAIRVMDVDPQHKDDQSIINEGINRFEAFLNEIGVPTKLSQCNVPVNEIAAICDDVAKVSFNSDGVLPCQPAISKEDIHAILQKSINA